MNSTTLPSSRLGCHARALAWLANLLALATPVLLLTSTLSAAQPESAKTCLVAGRWVVPSLTELRQATPSDVLNQARDASLVLLGEAHDNANHHLWQVQALAMLLGSRDQLVIGMEMFPRRVQPALDRWIAGELTESELLQQSDWDQVWRFDPDYYLPILRFARLNDIPIVALNVERSLISEIGANGLEAVPIERREGVTDPVPASTEYRNVLRSSFHQHGESPQSDFEHFVQAQLFWDRAFAQSLADAVAARPAALVVGIIGSGHLRYGHGVPHQLQSMGELRTRVWLPLDVSTDCNQLTGIADSVFPVHRLPPVERPRLGVYLSDETGGAGVRKVVPDSVAESAGIVAGDRIVAAAGVSIQNSDNLIAIVRRQSPGTWLPMTLERNGKRIDLVAKFPTEMAIPEATKMQRGPDPGASSED